MKDAPTTVVEVPPFGSAAKGVWTDDEKSAFIDYIARNPTAGDVIQDTGGIRKIRWGRSGMGKRGGVRVIYYYHSARLPLFLLTLYAKNVQSDLTAEQKKTMTRLVGVLIARYGK